MAYKGMTNKKQITLRIPNGLYEALKEESEKTNLSINELILLKVNPLNVDFQL